MNIVLQIIILILSTSLHEVSHGYVAYALGDPTAKLAGRLTLNPLAHLELFGSFLLPLFLYLSTGGAFMFGWAKPVPYNPYNLRGPAWLGVNKWGPALVALAGPGANLLIAIIFSVIIRVMGGSIAFLSVAYMIAIINIMLAVFNLIPIPPLDGSKLLFALLPYKWRSVEEFLNRYQLFILLGILFFGWQIISIPTAFLTHLLLPF